MSRNRKQEPDPPSVASLRDEMLHQMAPEGHEGPFYHQPSRQLLDRFEAALRRDWEAIERQRVEDQAVDAIRTALTTITEGRLL